LKLLHSTGLGREFTFAALKRGDKVIATARNLSKIQELHGHGADILELDVTWSFERLEEVVQQAITAHGRVDVLVNNAGYCAFGTLEEKT
jgi:NAD(P)-dependent dehydrogenase (short-subunit alcohol dehydrogenase family)